jgi:hypothetical protein
MANVQYESTDNAGHKPQEARRARRRRRPPFTFSIGQVPKPKRGSVMWRSIRRFGRGLLALGLAAVFLFTAWAIFRYSSPKLPVNSSIGGVSIFVSSPDVSVSLGADFQVNELDRSNLGGVGGLVTTDGTPGRFAIYTLTVTAPVGTKPNILVMFTGNATLDDAFFPPDDQSLMELHSPKIFQYRLDRDDRFRGDHPQAQAFYGPVRIRNKFGETLRLVGRRNGDMVERAGASAAVSFPAIPANSAAEIEFFNFVAGIWHQPNNLEASITVGPVPSYIRMEYFRPAPADQTDLTWTGKFVFGKAALSLSPKYIVTNRHEERRLGGLIFLAGVIAGLGGGFLVEGVRDVIDIALGAGSGAETKSQLRRSRYAAHRRRGYAAHRKRRYMAPHARPQTADTKKAQGIMRAGSQLLKVLASAFRRRRG